MENQSEFQIEGDQSADNYKKYLEGNVIDIDTVTIELVPYGNDFGDTGFVTAFKERPASDEEKNFKSFSEFAAAMFQRWIKMISADPKLSSRLDEVLQSVMWSYWGPEVIADPKHYDVMDMFFQLVSHESAQSQFLRITGKVHPQITKELLNQICPPYQLMFGQCTYFTGRRQFYEHFNGLNVILGRDANPMAVVEMANHRMSSFCIPISSMEDIEDIRNKFEASGVLRMRPLARVIFMPATEKDTNNTALCSTLASYVKDAGYKMIVNLANVCDPFKKSTVLLQPVDSVIEKNAK